MQKAEKMNHIQQAELVSRMRSALRAAIDEEPTAYDDYDRTVRHIHLRMTDAVNAERVPAGLRPVNLEDIRRTEEGALGHVDYFSKFALYCAALAMGREPKQ